MTVAYANFAAPANSEPGPREQLIVILVYGDQNRRREIESQLDDDVFDVRSFDGVRSAGSAIAQMISRERAVVVANDRLSDGSYTELINRVDCQGWKVPTIVTAFEPSIEGSVTAMRTGALDYITEPFSVAQLHHALSRIIS